MTQSLDHERELTDDEIKARTKLRDDLDDERDDLGKAIEDRRREIRTFTAKRKKLESQLRDVRRELRTGTVFESSQLTVPFPEVPQGESRHGEGPLLDPVELRHLITCVRPREGWPTVKQVTAWHPEVRSDVQKWCRNMQARAAHIAGEPLPVSIAMPYVLENVVFARAEKIEARRKGKPRTGQGRKPERARGRK